MDFRIVEYNSLEFSSLEYGSSGIVHIMKYIPEFEEPYDEEEYLKRLADKDHLILVAYDGDRAVGFKVGYDRYGNGSFYSWMGGVLPSYRRQNIARKLAEHQVIWAKEKGYGSIKLKTRNKHKAMLIFALSDGFLITGYEKRDNSEESRVILEKII